MQTLIFLHLSRFSVSLSNVNPNAKTVPNNSDVSMHSFSATTHLPNNGTVTACNSQKMKLTATLPVPPAMILTL